MLDKAFGLDVDVVMLDLEDGVVPAQKAEARASSRWRWGAAGPRAPRRVTSASTDSARLRCSPTSKRCQPGLDGIVVPKVETVDEVRDLDRLLARLESAAGAQAGRVRLMLAIESAKALIAAPGLAGAVPRVAGLMFGAEDFSRELGLPTIRTGMAREFTYARSAVVVAAAAARVTSVDDVWPISRTRRGWRPIAFFARARIYRQVDNPSARPPASTACSGRRRRKSPTRRGSSPPSRSAIGRHGSINFGGMLVHPPIYERARATVQAARATRGA